MQGMFKANGGCGYVKKPHFLLESGLNDEVFDPKADFPVKKTLKVKALLPGELNDVPFYVSLVQNLDPNKAYTFVTLI